MDEEFNTIFDTVIVNLYDCIIKRISQVLRGKHYLCITKQDWNSTKFITEIYVNTVNSGYITYVYNIYYIFIISYLFLPVMRCCDIPGIKHFIIIMLQLWSVKIPWHLPLL